jgi:hypothetical protein
MRVEYYIKNCGISLIKKEKLDLRSTKQSTPYPWNLHSAPTLLAQILFGIMHLCLELNSLHFLPDLGVHYALRHTPNFYEIHPWINYYDLILGYRRCDLCSLHCSANLPQQHSFVWSLCNHWDWGSYNLDSSGIIQ